MVERLTPEECAEAMKRGDFRQGLLDSSDKLAIVLTQSWCPQWTMMLSWLNRAAEEAGATVYYTEYDRETFFEEFMSFKEDSFKNRSIPYVRYYRGGKLVAESNFIAKDGFVRNLNKDAAGR